MFKAEQRKFGKLRLDANWYTKESELEMLATVVFKDTVVIDCRYEPHTDHFEYVIWSQDFALVPLGNEIPEYVAIMGTEYDVDDPAKPAVTTRTWELRDAKRV